MKCSSVVLAILLQTFCLAVVHTNNEDKPTDDDYIKVAEDENLSEEEQDLITSTNDKTSSQLDNFDYNQKENAYFIPPETGEYKFYTACTSSCQISLGDGKNLPKEQIISIDDEDFGSKKGNVEKASHTMYLQAGQNYLIQAIHKPKDNPTIGALFPDSKKQMPISPTFMKNDLTTHEFNHKEEKPVEDSQLKLALTPKTETPSTKHMAKATKVKLKSLKNKRLYRKLEQVSQFIKNMEKKKIQKEKFDNGVNELLKTFEKTLIQGPKVTSAVNVIGNDRSSIGGLDSKERSIIKLIDALKKNLIAEDQERKESELKYQLQIRDLFQEVSNLKKTVALNMKNSESNKASNRNVANDDEEMNEDQDTTWSDDRNKHHRLVSQYHDHERLEDEDEEQDIPDEDDNQHHHHSQFLHPTRTGGRRNHDVYEASQVAAESTGGYFGDTDEIEDRNNPDNNPENVEKNRQKNNENTNIPNSNALQNGQSINRSPAQQQQTQQHGDSEETVLATKNTNRMLLTNMDKIIKQGQYPIDNNINDDNNPDQEKLKNHPTRQNDQQQLSENVNANSLNDQTSTQNNQGQKLQETRPTDGSLNIHHQNTANIATPSTTEPLASSVNNPNIEVSQTLQSMPSITNIPTTKAEINNRDQQTDKNIVNKDPDSTNFVKEKSALLSNKDTSVTIHEDDLKTLERNLFSAFEEKVHNGGVTANNLLEGKKKEVQDITGNVRKLAETKAASDRIYLSANDIFGNTPLINRLSSASNENEVNDFAESRKLSGDNIGNKNLLSNSQILENNFSRKDVTEYLMKRKNKKASHGHFHRRKRHKNQKKFKESTGQSRSLMEIGDLNDEQQQDGVNPLESNIIKSFYKVNTPAMSSNVESKEDPQDIHLKGIENHLEDRQPGTYLPNNAIIKKLEKETKGAVRNLMISNMLNSPNNFDPENEYKANESSDAKNFHRKNKQFTKEKHLLGSIPLSDDSLQQNDPSYFTKSEGLTVGKEGVQVQYLARIRDLLGEINRLKDAITSIKRDKVFTFITKKTLKKQLRAKEEQLEELKQRAKNYKKHVK